MSILLLRPVLADAVKAGVAADALCAAAGLDSALLDDPDARISPATNTAFWREVVARSGDAYFGLHSGERLQLSTFGVVGYIAAHAATLMRWRGRKPTNLCISYRRFCTIPWSISS